ncbi:MAG: winged helix-turn-helix transcriptional regulator, partial [Bacteroidetes bacterium]|nr:winged helix-turn-helix transcriptional regulator [Bacteroidota bacterium]
MEILELKMNAILRRTDKTDVKVAQDTYKVSSSILDYKNHKLNINGKETKLTTKETELLRLFFERKNELLEREFALKHVWQDDSYFTARSMDVFISKIRKYLKEDESLQILNIHGQGYKLIDNSKTPS